MATRLATRIALSALVLGSANVGMSRTYARTATTPPTCFGQPATIVATEADTAAVGTAGADVIVATGRGVHAHGLGGPDLICGEGSINGGRGADRILGRRDSIWVVESTLRGGPGDDEIHRRGPRDPDPHLEPVTRGGRGDDELHGGFHMDEVWGGPGQDRIWGGPMWDDLKGGPGQDVVRGEGRGDTMVGGRRADLLIGGPGRDLAIGGRGHDRCRAEFQQTCN